MSPTRAALRLFELAFRPWMRTRITVRIAGLPRALPADQPLLIVANHVSWWDGFLLREVHRTLRPAAPLRVVMTERELNRNRVLGWIAAVPIRPGSPASVLRTFRGLRRLRARRSDLTVLFFPQGRIGPSHRRPLGFERGVATLARMLAPVRLLPVGLHVEPLNTVRPVAFALAGDPIELPAGARIESRRLEAAVERQIDAVHAFLAGFGEAAAGAWPDPFGALPPPGEATPVVRHLLHPARAEARATDGNNRRKG